MLKRVQTEVRTLLDDEGRAEPAVTPIWQRWIRFWVRVVQGFFRNRCPLWASALTYSSLLAFIPLLAVAIGITTGILKNDKERIRGWIDDVLGNVVPQLMRSEAFADKKDQAITFILQAIDNVNSGALGATGVVALLAMILFMLTRIEESLNGIWGVTRGRSWYSRMVNYWAAISLGPIVIIAAIGFSTSLRLERGKPLKFSPADLLDASALALKIKSPHDPVSMSLSNRFTASRDALNAWPGTGAPPASVSTALVRDLNALVAGESIYRPEAFEEISLRQQTVQLLAQKRIRSSSVARLNRLLLEDAYPAELAASGKSMLERLPIVGSLLVRMLPIPILSGACALFYMFMPNTRVQWRAAVMGGLTAGILWHLNNSASVVFVTQGSRDRAIYNSLAAVPVFMVGMYLFWTLLLFGAQVAYTYQNRRSYNATQAERIHQGGREFVALRIMIEAARAFVRGAPAPSNTDLAERLQVSGQLIRQTTPILLRTHLLVEISQADPGFYPGRPLEAIRVADVLEAMRRGVGSLPVTAADPSRATAEMELARVAAAEQEAGIRTLAELVEPQSKEAPAEVIERRPNVA